MLSRVHIYSSSLPPHPIHIYLTSKYTLLVCKSVQISVVDRYLGAETVLSVYCQYLEQKNWKTGFGGLHRIVVWGSWGLIQVVFCLTVFEVHKNRKTWVVGCIELWFGRFRGLIQVDSIVGLFSTVCFHIFEVHQNWKTGVVGLHRIVVWRINSSWFNCIQLVGWWLPPHHPHHPQVQLNSKF